MASLGPLPVAPGMVRCRYQYTYSGRNFYNVFHLKTPTTTPSAATLILLATALRGLWVTRIGPLISSNVALTLTDCVDLGVRDGAYGSNGTVVAATGVSSNQLPNSVALCISLPVAYRFRGGHARMYLPGQILTNTLTGNTWTGAWVTTAGTNMAGWVQDVNAMTAGSTTWSLQMLSYYTHNEAKQPIYRPGGPVPYPVLGAVVHTRIDSQRRRLGREAA